MTVRIAHANIRARDPQASLNFYEALGLEVVGCLRISPGRYLIYLGVQQGDQCTIELTINDEADASYDRSPGSGHIALAVGPLDRCIDRLALFGIATEGPPSLPAGPDGPRICFVRDPDGVRVELIDGDFPTPSDPLPTELARSQTNYNPVQQSASRDRVGASHTNKKA